MLAKPTKAIGEVLDRFEGKKFTCEYKYDGERAQVWFPKSFSDIIEVNVIRFIGWRMGLSAYSVAIPKTWARSILISWSNFLGYAVHLNLIHLLIRTTQCIKENTKSFVLDSEAVAIDTKTGKLMPFQELSRRKRKDVKLADIEVRVCLFAFDLLFLNGEVCCFLSLPLYIISFYCQPLLQKSLHERRRLLQEYFVPVDGEYQMAKSSDGETTDVIQAFLEESVKDGCEGLMVKLLDGDESHYEPSRRSVNWLKVTNSLTYSMKFKLKSIILFSSRRTI